MSDSRLINIADLVDPDTGKTYREQNLAKRHRFPVGTLVEFVEPSRFPEEVAHMLGLRLVVTEQMRDCDGTPLYALGCWQDEDEGYETWTRGWPDDDGLEACEK